MNMIANCIFLASIVTVSTVHGLTLAVPSIGAQVADSEVIVIGSFSGNDADAIFVADECLYGQVSPGGRIKIVPSGKNTFFDLGFVVGSLQGKQCLLIGDKCNEGLLLPYDAGSIWPFSGHSYKGLVDVKRCKEVVNLLLKYKRLAASSESELLQSLLADLRCVLGRMAATAFMEEDVQVWKNKEELRQEIGILLGEKLSRLNIVDEATVRFFYTGMPSIPSSISMRYLYRVYSKGEECRDLSKMALESYVKAHGYSSGQSISSELIESIVKRHIVSDMEKCSTLLRSEHKEIRICVPKLFALICQQQRPKGISFDEEIAYWLRVLEGLKNDMD